MPSAGRFRVRPRPRSRARGAVIGLIGLAAGCGGRGIPLGDDDPPAVVLHIPTETEMPEAALTATGAFRGNIARTGVYQTKGVHSLGGVRWRFKAEGFLWRAASPVVAGGVVYFGSSNHTCYRRPARFGCLYALDAATGRELWRLRTMDGPRTVPAVARGVVYYQASDLSLRAYDIRQQREKWRRELASGAGVSPAVAGGTVYVGYFPGEAFALDAETGAEKWRVKTPGQTAGAPAVTGGATSGGAVYVGCREGTLCALDAATGKIRWRYSTGGRIARTPAVSRGAVYFGSDWFYALDAATGRLRWKLRARFDGYTSPVVEGGVVYFAATFEGHNRYVCAVDARTGQPKWRHELEHTVFDSYLVLADGVLYCTSDVKQAGARVGRISALDAATGRPLWEHRLPDTIIACPAAADGMLYVPCSDDHLYAIADGGSGAPAAERRAGEGRTPKRLDVDLPPFGETADGLAVRLVPKCRDPDGITFGYSERVAFWVTLVNRGDRDARLPNITKWLPWKATFEPVGGGATYVTRNRKHSRDDKPLKLDAGGRAIFAVSKSGHVVSDAMPKWRHLRSGLPPGRYRLDVSYSHAAPHGKDDGCWQGTLEANPLEIVIAPIGPDDGRGRYPKLKPVTDPGAWMRSDERRIRLGRLGDVCEMFAEKEGRLPAGFEDLYPEYLAEKNWIMDRDVAEANLAFGPGLGSDLPNRDYAVILYEVADDDRGGGYAVTLRRRAWWMTREELRQVLEKQRAFAETKGPAAE